MAITLSTQIPQLLFSSAIPELAINTDGDGEVEIALTSAVLNNCNCKDFMRDNL